MMGRLVAAASAGVLVLATSSSGELTPRATSHVHLTDPAGDVLLAGVRAPDGPTKNVDIVRADIRRTSHFLVVRVTYDDLARRASNQWSLYFEVVTSRAHGYVNTVVWERGRYVDTGRWYQGLDVESANPEDYVRPQCPHSASAKVDYAHATVTIRVASRCLDGDPAWMRVDHLQTASREARERDDDTDNPFNTTGQSESTPRLVSPEQS